MNTSILPGIVIDGVRPPPALRAGTKKEWGAAFRMARTAEHAISDLVSPWDGRPERIWAFSIGANMDTVDVPIAFYAVEVADHFMSARGMIENGYADGAQGGRRAFMKRWAVELARFKGEVR